MGWLLLVASLLVLACCVPDTNDEGDYLLPVPEPKLLPSWVAEKPGTLSNPFLASTAYRDACFPKELPIMYNAEAKYWAPDILMFELWTSFSQDVHDRIDRLRGGLAASPQMKGESPELIAAVGSILKRTWDIPLFDTSDIPILNTLGIPPVNTLDVPVLDKHFITYRFERFTSSNESSSEDVVEFQARVRDALVRAMDSLGNDPIYFLAAADNFCLPLGRLAGREPYEPMTGLQSSVSYDPASGYWHADSAALYLCRDCASDESGQLKGPACLIEKEENQIHPENRMLPVLPMDPAEADVLVGRVVVRAAFVPVMDPDSLRVRLQLLDKQLALQDICSGEILTQFSLAD